MTFKRSVLALALFLTLLGCSNSRAGNDAQQPAAGQPSDDATEAPADTAEADEAATEKSQS